MSRQSSRSAKAAAKPDQHADLPPAAPGPHDPSGSPAPMPIQPFSIPTAAPFGMPSPVPAMSWVHEAQHPMGMVPPMQTQGALGMPYFHPMNPMGPAASGGMFPVQHAWPVSQPVMQGQPGSQYIHAMQQAMPGALPIYHQQPVTTYAVDARLHVAMPLGSRIAFEGPSSPPATLGYPANAMIITNTAGLSAGAGARQIFGLIPGAVRHPDAGSLNAQVGRTFSHPGAIQLSGTEQPDDAGSKRQRGPSSRQLPSGSVAMGEDEEEEEDSNSSSSVGEAGRQETLAAPIWNLDGESRLVIQFISHGTRGKYPQTYGRERWILPDGLSGKHNAYDQEWIFKVAHNALKEPVQIDSRLGEPCVKVTWRIIHVQTNEITEHTETQAQAEKRIILGWTIASRVFMEAMKKRVAKLQSELEQETDPSKREIIMTAIANLQPKGFTQGPLMFGLKHRCVQEALLNAASLGEKATPGSN